MEITGREILFSTIILCVMIGLGILVSRPIVSGLNDSALKMVQRVQVEKDSLKYDYIKRTEVGDFMASGVLCAVDPVRCADIPGEWLEIRKITERYTEHIHHHTETDSDGHTHTYTTTEHSWDRIDKDSWIATRVRFLGVVYDLREIEYSYIPKLDTTIYEHSKRGYWWADVGDKRWKYYTYPKSARGVMLGETRDKVWKGLCFREGAEIQGMIEAAERDIKAGPWIFWIIWSILTFIIIIGFYYLDNAWLEDE